MNEAETRAEIIDPKLKENGWGIIEGSKLLREYKITDGKIQSGGLRDKKLIADYVLVYKGLKLAVVEAKSDTTPVSEGVAQAKLYADKLKLDYAYSTNGNSIYFMNFRTGEEKLVNDYLSPDELWNLTFSTQNYWHEQFASIPFEDKSGTWELRYYQEIAVNSVLEAIANKNKRILLTLATGTGKTAIAFQIAWKLFYSRWNLMNFESDKIISKNRPRILFLADRNILANQAYNSFSAFPEDALIRISPNEIRKKGSVPTNGSIFFTIFQTFMTGIDDKGKPAPYFGDYPKDFFDFIIIDECHRGGANDESTWRDILEYFSPAFQLGLTATPKKQNNIDTYKYFGEPVYVYSLKDGINDGFLTPFRVKKIQTTLDDYTYTNVDIIIEGTVEPGKRYEEPDFNKRIEIIEREKKRVKIFLEEADPNEKTIIFCANQIHAAMIRDLVNQLKASSNKNYCVRVTADDNELGEQYLRDFQDNERTIPTILTTSQKLSTGVDARNVRNIVLLRPVNSMIEFKQIVGRGTRLFEGKEYFTIFDYVKAYHHFADPEWDGEPIAENCEVCGQLPCICERERPEPRICPVCGKDPCECLKEPPGVCSVCGQSPCICNRKVKIRLADGKERQIQHMIDTTFWSPDGGVISAKEFMEKLFGKLPALFSNEDELRNIWGNPITRLELLEKLDEAGFNKKDLKTLQKLVNLEKSDLFDVLEYVYNSGANTLTRTERAEKAKPKIFALLNENQRVFIDFVLSKYVESGVDELMEEKLPLLLESKYQTYSDAMNYLGEVKAINELFSGFQKHLYSSDVA